MEKLKEFYKKNQISVLAVTCATVIVAGLIIFAVCFFNAKNNAPEEGLENFKAIPSAEVSFEKKQYSIELGGNLVQFASFVEDSNATDPNTASYMATSSSMGLIVYTARSTDYSAEEVSAKWMTDTFLPSKKLTPDELYYHERGSQKAYLALGYAANGLYIARAVVTKGDSVFIVSFSTSDFTPPKDKTQIQQIKEAAFLGMSTLTIIE